MRFGSVCSGIEAASVAWNPLGWHAAWLSEIEPFPSGVLAHHYPDVPNLGDMTTLPRRILAGEVEAPDVFCGGTPCQAFSVAGLRKSLEDARGNLSLTFCEIADAIDYIRDSRGEQPGIIFWENVPGVLSTKDNAFGCFLAGLAGEDDPLQPAGGKWSNAGLVLGPKRAVAWRTLDAQYFGVAQRRRRVFVVASARDGFSPAEVLFEWDGVRRDTAPSREARQATTRGIEFGPGGGRFTDLNPTLDARAKDGPIRNQLAGAVLQNVTATLDASYGRLHGCSSQDANHGHSHLVAFGGNNTSGEIDVLPALNCNGGQRSGDFEAGAILAYATRTANTNANGHGVAEGVTHTRDQAQGQAICFSGRDYGQDVCFDVSPTMRSLSQSANGHQSGSAGLAVAFHPTQDPISSTDGSTHAIGCGSTGGQASVAVAYEPYTLAIRGRNDGHNLEYRQDGTANALLTPNGGRGGIGVGAVAAAMQVRRLTPVECERLQGFPNGYTAIPWRTYQESQRKGVSYETLLTQRGMTLRGPSIEECPDGPRYKALGNSWAVPVVRWIGKRIDHQVKSITNEMRLVA